MSDASSSQVLIPVGPSEEEAARRALDSGLYDHLPADTALLMRTSGSSSGVGKTVVISRDSLMASADATHAALGGPGHWACALSTHHIAGLQTVFRAARAGTRAISAGRGTPEELAAAAEEMAGERAYLSLVPTQLRRLLDSPYTNQARAFAAILLGGAAAAPELLRRSREAGLHIVTTYGMTETCGGCVYNGVPIGDTQLSLGEHGQIAITGSVVATGYLTAPPSETVRGCAEDRSAKDLSFEDRPAEEPSTQDRAPQGFSRQLGILEPFDGSFITQDSGHWANNRLQILGRLDAAITTGGLTVIPGIIERELEKLGAGECVVVGIPDEQWGEIVVALTTNPLDNPAAELRKRFEAGYVPKTVLSVRDLGLASLPYLESGKVDRVTAARLVLEKL
ncbi:MAG: AMP-binding protein [Ancrocorticia sp.]